MVPWAGKGVGVRMKLWSRAGVVAGVLAWLLTAGAAGAGAASLSVQVLSKGTAPVWLTPGAEKSHTPVGNTFPAAPTVRR